MAIRGTLPIPLESREFGGNRPLAGLFRAALGSAISSRVPWEARDRTLCQTIRPADFDRRRRFGVDFTVTSRLAFNSAEACRGHLRISVVHRCCLFLLAAIALSATGCVQRSGNLAQTDSSAGESVSVDIDQVERSDLYQLAQRLGLRGGEGNAFSQSRRPAANQSFVGIRGNSSFPRGGNGTFARGGNLSAPRGLGGNGTFGRRWPLGGANGSFPGAGGNGTFPRMNPGGNGSFPRGGGNGTFNNPRFVPLGGPGFRALPLDRRPSNTTFGDR